MDITKIFKFEGSHVVRNCTSTRCSRSVHGHSYTVELCFTGSSLDGAQMLMDFGLMKTSIKEFIDSMDHCHIICSTDSEEYRNFFKNHNERWIEVPFNPSAEMLSVFIMRFVQLILSKTEFNNNECSDLRIKSVTVHETATGRATCYEDDVKTLWNDLWLLGVCFSHGVIKDWSTALRTTILEGPKGPDDKVIKNPKVKHQINLPTR